MVGLRGEAEVDPVGHDDLVPLDAGVELGVAAQAKDGEPGEQGEQADRPLRIGRVQRPPRLDQVGGVHVDPDGRLGDLPAGAGQLVGRRAPRAAQRDPALAGPGLRAGVGRASAPAAGSRAAMARRTSSRLTTPSGPVPVTAGQVEAGVPGFLADDRRDHRDPAGPVGRCGRACGRLGRCRSGWRGRSRCERLGRSRSGWRQRPRRWRPRPGGTGRGSAPGWRDGYAAGPATAASAAGRRGCRAVADQDAAAGFLAASLRLACGCPVPPRPVPPRPVPRRPRLPRRVPRCGARGDSVRRALGLARHDDAGLAEARRRLFRLDGEQRLPDGDGASGLGVQGGDDARVGDGDLDDGLGGLHLGDHLVDRDAVAGLDAPGDDLGLLESLAEVGEQEVRHCPPPTAGARWRRGCGRCSAGGTARGAAAGTGCPGR